MRASINKNIVHITGKLCEELKISEICNQMMKEFNTMCMVEFFGNKQGCEIVDVTMCYSENEATVLTVKESYSESKKLAI